MHFTVLYFKENTTLEELESSYSDVADFLTEDFGTKYCDCCGETEPEVSDICDWFQIGGRWCDALKATKGYSGSLSWCNVGQPEKEGQYSIVNSTDLDEDFLQNNLERGFYGVATESDYFEEYDPEFKDFMTKLKNKEIKGVVVLIDCHD